MFIKTICSLAILLPVANTAWASSDDKTLTVGYAHTDFKKINNDFLISNGEKKDIHGVNAKYYYEASDRFGFIVSGTVGKNSVHRRSDLGRKYKFENNYYNLSVGPAWRVTDWLSLYSTVGISALQSRIESSGTNQVRKKKKRGRGIGRRNSSRSSFTKFSSEYGVSAGAGMQFNLFDNFVLDTSWERAWLRNNHMDTWVVGVGYRF